MQSVSVSACQLFPVPVSTCLTLRPPSGAAGLSAPDQEPTGSAEGLHKAAALASSWKGVKHQHERAGLATPVSSEPQGGGLQGG